MLCIMHTLKLCMCVCTCMCVYVTVWHNYGGPSEFMKTMEKDVHFSPSARHLQHHTHAHSLGSSRWVTIIH